MISKKALLLLALPISISSAFARTEVIPPAEQIVKSVNENASRLVLKNAKGTILEKSLLAFSPENWFNLSPSEGVEGVRTEETYLAFGAPQSADVIVAVIDSGVDVNHEDLQGKIWINSKEIAENGIDDDNNGYIDDVFGWNFIGGSNGMAKIVDDATLGNGKRLIKGNPAAQISADTLEVTREVIRMKKLKEKVEELGETLTPGQQAYLEKVTAEVDAVVSVANKNIADYTAYLNKYKASEAVLTVAGVSTMTIESVRAVVSADPAVVKAKADMLMLLSNGLNLDRINLVIDHYSNQVAFNYNVNFNPRPIVLDNYANQTEKNYGNNDVIGADARHGTHVAGIIAAARDNAIGMNGVATNVKIMAVRVVPDGDERDKDVANGIRYAVDNGAKIINMSFGKAYGPNKKIVDDAVKYAESKGVLLVHAAGNSNQDNDTGANFPNRYSKATGVEFTNWLEIGASSYQKGAQLPAKFSNYGKKSVDLFSPGVDIYSTTPDNTYSTLSGTSMASPAAAGVAALVLSYDQSLSASSLRTLLLDTSRRYPKLQVKLPGTQTDVLFSSLSRTGTIIDVFEAVQASR